MIPLHPKPLARHKCPYCNEPLDVRDWYMPGMRMLADLACEQCGKEYYGDLPAGHGLPYPMLLEKSSGIVHNHNSRGEWFATWLRESYANRTTQPIPVSLETFREIKQPVVLNCLDILYGHSLLKLLNAQYYLDQRPELDLILVVPRILRWMIPEGVAALWTVDLPLRQGTMWNDWLANRFKELIAPFAECHLSIAFSHPHPKDFCIERFTCIKPFNINTWEQYLEQPAVSFIWREDRLWRPPVQYDLPKKITRKIKRTLGLEPTPLKQQQDQVLALASNLRSQIPNLDFAVIGLGKTVGFPGWITDLRATTITDALEKAWCQRYAQSHIVIGIHGSNMLLPSAHAGAVIELMPTERWGNIIQDLLPPPDDLREIMFRFRIIPETTNPEILSKMAISLIKHHQSFMYNMQRKFCDHDQISSTLRSNISSIQKL